MKTSGTDFVVVGAGVFGAWTAHWLRRQGHTVTLVDGYGAGNNRSSSGDE
jgi:glycine/D-amino acid oxidase-like deaminating enzyme